MKVCPECFTPLDLRKHKIFHCWECPEGHGNLYPKGELEKIVRAVSGLGDLELRIWQDHERYGVEPSSLRAPDSGEQLLEIHDRDYPRIHIYGDPVTHSLWLHAGEEEKLTDHIEEAANVDSVAAYLKVAADEAARIFDDSAPVADVAGHTLTALKLLGERIIRAFPHISL